MKMLCRSLATLLATTALAAGSALYPSLPAQATHDKPKVSRASTASPAYECHWWLEAIGFCRR